MRKIQLKIELINALRLAGKARVVLRDLDGMKSSALPVKYTAEAR